MPCMTSISKNEMNIQISLCNGMPGFEWNPEDFSGNPSEKDALNETNTCSKKLKYLRNNKYC